jgi:hypothetical protein
MSLPRMDLETIRATVASVTTINVTRVLQFFPPRSWTCVRLEVPCQVANCMYTRQSRSTLVRTGNAVLFAGLRRAIGKDVVGCWTRPYWHRRRSRRSRASGLRRCITVTSMSAATLMTGNPEGQTVLTYLSNLAIVGKGALVVKNEVGSSSSWIRPCPWRVFCCLRWWKQCPHSSHKGQNLPVQTTLVVVGWLTRYTGNILRSKDSVWALVPTSELERILFQ